MHFTQALTRLPGPNFADGITTANLGKPDYELAQQQHDEYCTILSQLGVAVKVLPPDPAYPDGCFVEDTAIITERGTILANPGDPTRSGEVAALEHAIVAGCLSPIIARIKPPGALDGGDVLRIDGAFIIGASDRTNVAGAEQLAASLQMLGFTAQVMHVPGNLLHLKTGVSYIGKKTLVVCPSLADHNHFASFRKIVPSDIDCYAANTLLVNGTVLVPSGFPGVSRSIRDLGIPVVETPMTEFQKMDGGLSCLSLLV